MIDLGDGLTLQIHAGEGYRMVMRGNINICIDNNREIAFNTMCREQAGDVTGKKVAWIGGGMCIGPRLFEGAKQTVYELLPALKRFCPDGVKFVGGDWQDTISGKFDVIVYDLGGEVPREELSKFLTEGGACLPSEGSK